MDAPTRYALYVTPEPGSALAAFGDAILGDTPPPDWDPADREALAAVTAAPRVYGFHATLKAPMRLAPGRSEDDLVAACTDLVQARSLLPIGPLAVVLLGDFVALVPTAPPPELGLFAAECVAALDPFRAPLTPTERARRRSASCGGFRSNCRRAPRHGHAPTDA